MKTTITFNVMILALLMSFTTQAQTHVYNETTSSGIFFQGNGEEVSNPNSDAVNSSATVAKSGTGGSWQQIQYFPTYTPATGDKLYFSVYDPNNVGTGQIKFEYTSNPGTWVDGGDVTYVSGTDQGWKEQSISLDGNAGNEINKIIIMPGYDTNNAVYVDNIYFNNESTLSTRAIEAIEGFVYFDTEGRINFENNQTDAELKVFDLSGRLLIHEHLEGKTSKSSLSNRGVYILKVTKADRISTKKLFFR